MWRSTPQHFFFLRGIFWNIIQRKKKWISKSVLQFFYETKSKIQDGQFTFSFLWSKGTIDHALCCICESFSLAMDFLSLPMTYQLRSATLRWFEYRWGGASTVCKLPVEPRLPLKNFQSFLDASVEGRCGPSHLSRHWKSMGTSMRFHEHP